jgi:hypothetical protein
MAAGDGRDITVQRSVVAVALRKNESIMEIGYPNFSAERADRIVPGTTTATTH